MIEPITNVNFLNNIQNGIKSHGVYLMGVTDRDKDSDPWTGGYLYTIGHKERQRPDLVLVVYHKDKDSVSEKVVEERFRAAHILLNSLVKHWETAPVLAGHTAQDEQGILYKIHAESEFDKSFKEFTIQASNYYGTEDYPLLILMPVGYVQ